MDVMVSLGGVVRTAGGELRLPLDVCRHIAELTRPVPWRTCEWCNKGLLVLHHRLPFVARLSTSWLLDPTQMLLTSQGTILCDSGMDEGQDQQGKQSTAAPAAASTLVLHGDFGCARPETTPDRVTVHCSSGTFTFQNQISELRQLRWYKVANGHYLCRSCFSELHERCLSV